MKRKNIFCSRKGKATIRGKHYYIRTSDILAREIERQALKMEKRNK